MTLCVIHHINWPFWPVDIGCAVLPAWLSCPLPAAFSGSPLRGHRRVSHADGLSVFKVRCWIWQQKIATQQPEPDHPFRDGLGSGSLCSDRKLKTCSGSFGSRAGTLSKYVILNCWNRLPHKSSFVNKKFWKHATFGGLQENARRTLVKRERVG